MSKKSTLSWRKYRSPKIRRIFGLHSTPANTTHALLKTAYLSGFRLQGVFPPHMSPEKQNRRRERRRSLHIWFIDRLTVRAKGRCELGSLCLKTRLLANNFFKNDRHTTVCRSFYSLFFTQNPSFLDENQFCAWQKSADAK